RLAYLAGKQLILGRREFDLLHYLVQNRERPVSRQELIEQVWGESIDPLTNVVDVHVRNIRRKLGLGRTGIIRTIHGIGYQAKA
ncbi:MAG: winged helix family two component transcriptional regulator, partial [Candidatus Berkelbacteria bacterium Gr01-1014_85]